MNTNNLSIYVRNFHPKDQIYNHYFINNGKIEGELIEYYINGFVRSKCNYIDGKLYGEFKQFYNNSKLEIQCIFNNNNILIGSLKSYNI